MEGLDSDEFGPMMGADFFQDSTELEMLKRRQAELLEQKRIAEAEFNQQRAKFMELFKQKEDDLRLTRDQLAAAQNRCSNLESQLTAERNQLENLSTEINDIKTTATISEVNRGDEMEKVQRKYREELASLQSIIAELTIQVEQSSAAQYEQEIAKLLRQKEKLENELQETRNKVYRDREGILTSITKTLQKRVGNVDPRETEEENLEYSMKKAQEDADKLRSVITPFEEEISSLKAELRHCHEHMAVLEGKELKGLQESSRRRRSHPNPSSLPSCDQAQDFTDSIAIPKSSSDIPENISSKDEGVRFVKRQEWDALQRQLEVSKRPCLECERLRAELKLLQEDEKRMQDRLNSVEHLLENEKLARLQLEQYKASLEMNLNIAAKEARSQISTLTRKVQDSEEFLEGAKKRFSDNKRQLREQMNTMTTYREDLQAELTRLQVENEELVGKHSRFAQELQEEFINLPSNVEDIQVLLLKYREEVITAKVSKEHAESVSQRELESARSQLQQQNLKEINLAQEINQLREELAIRNSLYSELEQRMRESETLLTISNLQSELNECKTAKINLERTVQHLNARIEALRTDLENSEAGQKDFIKFSQSLQIELSKFRLSEREVRWQHPDDVTECGDCQKSFVSVPSEKAHCQHCGHIFCEECVARCLPSGPNQRSANLCHSCYNSLVRAKETVDLSHLEMSLDHQPRGDS